MKNIKLPAPQLSYLKEVDIDLDMTGRHYVKLATSEGQIPEEVALDILTDLVKQDANNLTLSELRYLFMLVKINALDNKYSVIVSCTHPKKDGTECGHTQEVEVKLSDSDLNRTPADYTPPTIDFVVGDKEEHFTVFAPKAKDEIDLIRYFMIDKGYSEKDLTEDKEVALNFTFLRALLHLQKDGISIVENSGQYDELLKLFDKNKYKTVVDLYKKMNEVDSFGVQMKTYEVTCKECGGKLIFRPPLLHGFLS